MFTYFRCIGKKKLKQLTGKNHENCGRILGILILIAGIASILFSNYITEQVLQGKAKVKQGEKAVSQGNQLFSLNPLTKSVGQNLTNPMQKKINEGKETIAHYEQLAQTLKVGGIVGIVVGAGLIIVSFVYKGKAILKGYLHLPIIAQIRVESPLKGSVMDRKTERKYLFLIHYHFYCSLH